MNALARNSVLVAGALLIASAAWYWLYYQDEYGELEGVVCTQEAKECPDGSYVGRVGPNCEFAPCPGN